jgi:hypothetical protein
MRAARGVHGLGIVLVIGLFAATALAAASQWHNLRGVTVKVQNPSLPPPYGRAHTYSFTTASKLAKATAALNDNHIAKRAAVQNMMCAGGYNVTIRVVQAPSTTVTLSAYECGDRSFGDVAGNVPGVLKALGISAP